MTIAELLSSLDQVGDRRQVLCNLYRNIDDFLRNERWGELDIFLSLVDSEQCSTPTLMCVAIGCFPGRAYLKELNPFLSRAKQTVRDRGDWTADLENVFSEAFEI